MHLHPPRPNNAGIACAGGNFADHAAAMAVKMRGRPYEGDAHQEIRNAGFWGVWKLGREIVGPDGELIYPDRCNRLDYEGEIAIVLGKRGLDLKPSQLKDYIWGITMLADWSIRAPRETPGGPLSFGIPKNFDTSCSMGPCIVVGEVVLRMSIWRHWSTGSAASVLTRAIWSSRSVSISNICRATLRFIREILSAAERQQVPLRISSELLADKTSAPERFLQPGDVVEMRSPSIGSLRTRVVGKGNKYSSVGRRWEHGFVLADWCYFARADGGQCVKITVAELRKCRRRLMRR